MENVKLFTLVAQINELPPFPNVAHRIIAEIDKNDTSAKQLSEIILLDTSLTLKIINISNSAYYSPRNPIKNVTHAIQYLGFNTIKSIAYTSAVQVVKSKDDNNPLVNRFHEKCIITAYVARVLINKINFFRKTAYIPEDFYILALLHSVGEVVIAVHYPEHMQEIIDKINDGADITQVEGKLKHGQIGLMLMRKWNMPEIYAQVCSKHHVLDPEKVTSEILFINDILMIAECIAYKLGFNPTYNNNIDIANSISRVGLREDDVLSNDGILGEVEENIESQLTFLT